MLSLGDLLGCYFCLCLVCSLRHRVQTGKKLALAAFNKFVQILAISVRPKSNPSLVFANPLLRV